MAGFSKTEVEASIRREAARRAETVLELRWHGDNPVVTLDTRGRTTDEMSETATLLVRDAFKPILERATADVLRRAFGR